MNISIIVTNYNYSQFLEKALNSIIHQDYNNYEAIVVDDGSSDNSKNILSKFKNNKKFKIIFKENDGQLSCFNKAYNFLSGDIICFLDADDIYTPNYLKEIANIYNRYNDCDFLFVNKKYIDEYDKVIMEENNDKIKDDFVAIENLGFTLIRSFYLKYWLGSSTSCISIRKKILDKILPLPFEKDWKIRADDVLVWGASLVGAKKYKYKKSLIKYRIHSSNYFYGKKYDITYHYHRQINIIKMFKYILEKNKITPDITSLIFLEYDSANNRKLLDLIDYLKIIALSNLPLIFKIKYSLTLVSYHLKTIFNSNKNRNEI